ncbi:hypothetical protein H5410_051746 [Solanum commersonii]|uniref:Uncharacterized protein n=1 Tax=Solanum commersonii TaxID=4109 RepID=A0A9J5X0C5_SOLCO|nr:hypothetical protein H5410_051746 [Solanum commersonii]
MLLQITYQDKTTQTEKENTIEDILKAITTRCIKVDTMDNEIQKLKSKVISQSHDYKHAEICQSEDTKHPELEGDVGILQKTHNNCFNAAAEILYDEIKPIIQVVKIGLTRDMIIPEDIGQQPEIQEIEIPSFYANKRIIDQLMIYSNSRELRQADMDEVQKWILSLLKLEEQPITRALKKGFISNELLTRYCKLIGHKYPDHICSKCNREDNVIPDVQLE